MSKQKMESTPLNNSVYSTPIHYSMIEYQIKFLSGKILTLIDGIFPQGIQNKAVKDVIKTEIRNILFELQALSSDGNSGHTITDSELENNI